MQSRKHTPSRGVKRANLEGKYVRNQILLAINDAEFALIRPHLKFLDLPRHLTLHQPHRNSRFVHFPNDGLISLVVEMRDGKTVEAGLVGNEGVSGISGVFGLSHNPLREIMQVGGTGFRMTVQDLTAALGSAPQLHLVLNRYAAGLAMQVAQTAACNRLHTIERRLARWLLIAHDRVDSAVIEITHDFLATMLGTDRPTVSIAAGILQKHKIIRYTRGAVKVLNRPGLERFACECYGIVRQYNGNSV